MLLTYYMWIKAVKTGSIYWAAMCALAYFYMVSFILRFRGISASKNPLCALPVSAGGGKMELDALLFIKPASLMRGFINNVKKCEFLDVNLRFLGFFPGFLVGRLRFSDQPDPPARPGADVDRPLLSPHLRRLLHRLLLGHHPVHADLVRRLPGARARPKTHNFMGFSKKNGRSVPGSNTVEI